MRKILVVGAGEMQTGSIQKAKEMGLYVIAVDINPNAPGFRFADQKEIVSTNDIPAVVEVAKKNGINAIITCSDLPVRTIAAVGEALSIPAISVENSYRATNKLLMREAFKAYGVPIPYFFKAVNEGDFFKAVTEVRSLGCRCIIKPADNSGSRGVILLDKYDAEYLKDAYWYSRNNSHSGAVIVEEFMEGPEVCVETLNYNGVCYPIQITDKLTTGAPYFVEMGHSQPSQYPLDIQEEIKRVAIAANMAIGNYNGSSCTEIKITRTGVKVVELGARLAGDYMTSDLVPLSTGVDMLESIIKIALGEKPDYKHKFKKASAVRFISAEAGIIESVSGLEVARNISGVVRADLYCQKGDRSVVIQSSLDRLGYIIAQADTAAEAIKICEEAMSNIIIKVKEE